MHIDVFTFDEISETLEWHARKLAICDGKDPDALTNGMVAASEDRRRPQWTAYLPEAKRFMIGLEAWSGRGNSVSINGRHGSDHAHIEDAIMIDETAQPGEGGGG